MSRFYVICSRGIRFIAIMVGLLLASSGCEWTGTGSDQAWNDSMSWVNFSGFYRAPAGRSNLVGEFGSSGVVSGGGQTSTGTGDAVEFAYANVPGPIQDPPFTVVSGAIPYPGRGTPGIRLKAGSVDITFRGTIDGTFGAFTDNGSGALSGSYSQGPGGPAFPASGSINYDTGTWSLQLNSSAPDSDPFAEPAQIYYSYVVEDSSGTGVGGEGETGNGDPGASLSIAGGSISTMSIEQLGNQLTIRTSRGHVLSGRLSTVTLPGGDSTGRSAGDVTATYEVSGDIDGQTVRITGTLSGVYVPPGEITFANATAPIIYGIMSNRILQGIWIQANGTADVLGQAPQQSVPINVGDFQSVVDDDKL